MPFYPPSGPSLRGACDEAIQDAETSTGLLRRKLLAMTAQGVREKMEEHFFKIVVVENPA